MQVVVHYQNRFKIYKPVASEDPFAYNYGGDLIVKEKRSTKGIKPKGRNVGRLVKLVYMPLDIFHEIMSCLHPMDILQLSRSSVYFRSLLTTKEARTHCWRAARVNLGMPDCPPDLSEMQYVALLFEHNCFACGVNRAVNTSYGLKVRFCSACYRKNVEMGRHLLRPHNSSPENRQTRLDHFIFTLLISAGDYRRHVGSLENGRKADDFKPFDADDKQRLNYHYYAPEFEAVLEEYLQVREDEISLARFVEKRKSIICDALRFNYAISKWQSDCAAYLADERVKKRRLEEEQKQENKDIILQRLATLGYTVNDLPKDNKSWDELLRRRDTLTDRYWDRILFPKLKVLLDRRKAELLELEKKRRLYLRKEEFFDIFKTLDFKEAEIKPHLEDLLRFSVISDFLAEDDAWTTVTRERVSKSLNESTIAAEYNSKIRTVFLDKISRVLLEEVDDEILDLPSTLFQCNRCFPRPLLFTYSAFTEHFNRCHRDNLTNSVTDQLLAYVIYHNTASDIAKQILEMLGLAENVNIEAFLEFQQKVKVICLCGRPDFMQPATFPELVKHVWKEIAWFDETESVLKTHDQPPPEVQFIDDHNIQTGNCIALLPSGQTLQTFLTESVAETHPIISAKRLGGEFTAQANWSNYCRHCPPYSPGMLPECIIWHMNTKHLKKVEDSDVLGIQRT